MILMKEGEREKRKGNEKSGRREHPKSTLLSHVVNIYLESVGALSWLEVMHKVINEVFALRESLGREMGLVRGGQVGPPSSWKIRMDFPKEATMPRVSLQA